LVDSIKIEIENLGEVLKNEIDSAKTKYLE
jgi:hypothetical protein